MNYRIRCLTTRAEIQTHAPRLAELAGSNPFMHTSWLLSWCTHLGQAYEIYLLLIEDGANIVGFAPLFRKRDHRGRVLHFLGSGKACGDHLTFAAHPGQEVSIGQAVADWLCDVNRNSQSEEAWEAIELIGADRDEPSIVAFQQRMRERGLLISGREGLACHYLDLSQGFEAYLAGRSKSTRRRLRQYTRTLQEPDTKTHFLHSAEEVVGIWPTFCDLHQRWRTALNEEGCFTYPGFSDFLLEASQQMARLGRLTIVVTEYQGIPIGVSHLFHAGDKLFNYQSGMDPTHAEKQPGFLTLFATLQQVNTRGFQGVDFLRGDEPYKQRWQAYPIPAIELRIASTRPRAVVFHHLWNSADALKEAFRRTGSSQ